MINERENAAPGANGGNAHRAEVGNLGSEFNIDGRPTAACHTPDRRVPISLGVREREMLRALQGGARTRVELSQIRLRLGLSGPATVQRLRRKGIQIESVWHKVEDSEGQTVRFVSYHLIGKVPGVAL